MLQKDIELLKPEFKQIAKWIIETAFSKFRVRLYINETVRTQELQTAYYKQGREPLDKVNAYRKSIKMWEISEYENKRIVTNVSKIDKTKGHGAGLAIDVVPNNDWSSPQFSWNIIGVMVDFANDEYKDYLKSLNAKIVWGGNFKSIRGGDSPHIEMVYDS